MKRIPALSVCNRASALLKGRAHEYDAVSIRHSSWTHVRVLKYCRLLLVHKELCLSLLGAWNGCKNFSWVEQFGLDTRALDCSEFALIGSVVDHPLVLINFQTRTAFSTSVSMVAYCMGP